MARLAAVEKVERDKDLCRLRARGATWEELGKKFELDPRSCRKIWAAFAAREKPRLGNIDPAEHVWMMAERYEQWIEQAYEIGISADNDNARLGAINTQMRLQEKQVELLQHANILPRDLGRLKVDLDVRFIIKQIIQIFREEGVPSNVEERILELVRPGSQN